MHTGLPLGIIVDNCARKTKKLNAFQLVKSI